MELYEIYHIEPPTIAIWILAKQVGKNDFSYEKISLLLAEKYCGRKRPFFRNNIYLRGRDEN